jgi:hypothetical protein
VRCPAPQLLLLLPLPSEWQLEETPTSSLQAGYPVRCGDDGLKDRVGQCLAMQSDWGLDLYPRNGAGYSVPHRLLLPRDQHHSAVFAIVQLVVGSWAANTRTQRERSQMSRYKARVQVRVEYSPKHPCTCTSVSGVRYRLGRDNSPEQPCSESRLTTSRQCPSRPHVPSGFDRTVYSTDLAATQYTGGPGRSDRAAFSGGDRPRATRHKGDERRTT